MKYNPQKIESKWQKIWSKNNFKIWHAKNTGQKKIYILDMFPYPSGEGLHVGHIEGYTATDILTRYYLMKGYNVLHPMGWDAFGLPAENYAIKNKIHPALVVDKNVKHFRQQLQSLGFNYDWQREINTTDPNYYKWTQWIFLKLFEKGLAYEAETPVNFCPACRTVLADEEVVEGKCERCGTIVERRKLRQWMLKITAYASRLLNDLSLLTWPEKVKLMQKNWIGRSEGAEIKFKVVAKPEYITVFTTRPDTIFGATYLVLAPEHPLLEKIIHPDYLLDVKNYILAASQKSDFERQSETKEKTGVFSGAYAINPANQEKIPIWISDYVLMNYGTGAIMAVPAHDERDFDFAKTFHLAIREVISPNGKTHSILDKPYLGSGILVNSGPFNNMPSEEVKDKILVYVGARKTIQYKLRDWIFSRQRYWGEPIPIIKCEKCGNVALKEKDLPLKLPMVKHYQPSGTGESPLATIKEWVNVKCPSCGGPAKRETNTMPQWAGSSWYYLAYLLKDKLKVKKAKKFWNKKILNYWLGPTKEKKGGGVDIYIGGVEHAVLHLLYARFWHKFLFDLGVVNNSEPFYRLVNQGIILGEDNEKMSKSRGNVVNPDNIIKTYGADTLRIYEMFMGPLQDSKPWDSKGIIGIYRFLNRVWQLAELLKEEKVLKKEKLMPLSSLERRNLEKNRHKTIKKVTEDIENLRFNTAIAALMEYLNQLNFVVRRLNKAEFKKHLITLTLLLSPFAPHLAEEIFHTHLKNKKTIQFVPWPKYQEAMLKETTFTLVVQINGKMRLSFKAPINISEKEAVKLALKQPNIKKYLVKGKYQKIIFVPNRLINFVT